ncbi:neuralized-like protein 4 [Anabrus simplex]|uniref:neuralized-like protein 4 n=1 Tax=Anabrus simplex TaxID=316456 RepID=UPI0034DCE64F
MAAMFHRRCGERVTLTNGSRTAVRNFSEFNYGLVLSNEPLVDNQLFEVRIDKKINSWSGSIEIGVTTCDPETLEFPSSATDLRDGSWIMSGNSILKDGRSVVEVYGIDLDKLTEGDRIGVMRTSEGELVFYVNGVSQGVAAEDLPSRVFAVVDMYGKCAQVSITDADTSAESERSESEGEINNDHTMMTTTNLVANLNVNMNVNTTLQHGCHSNQSERLQFHERCGSLVKLSCNNRTAERRRPLDEFNNGVVMTHRPLRDNELFEIRIDRLVDKWSGSIEVGITTHNPTALEFPATMTNMRSGTTMMSGCGILTNGKGTRREYGEFNLDELREGDRIGMMRKANGNLHYFINGLDQGVAATKVPACVWGVVDLYGMTVKVTIVDRDEREEQNLITRRNTALRDHQILHGLNELPDEDFVDRLMFHPNCGTHAAVINNCRTAHRPNAMDDFNNGVVLTNRPLKPNELFEVRLDKMVTKWAGSIEIGVTTHNPTELEYPSTMTNVRSGTWMMTGNGVMHNGTTVIDEYGQNLDRLQVGDRVGVMRKENGTLHFFVNGTDQGAAASNIPDRVFGVIDLYGQAAQATIVDSLDCYSPDTVNSSLSNTTLYSDLRFHHVHGKNARVSNNGLTASRPRAFGEFNDAIVIGNRALREGEMFEVIIEKMVDRWSGSIEAGVTAIRPEDLDFPSTMTDINHDTWMLSGSAVMQDGVTLRNGYSCDLDALASGTRIGMMRHDDGTLHYYIDGIDQGAACGGVPPHVYAVIDLYGQCAQVSILPADRRDNTAPSDLCQPVSLAPIGSTNSHMGAEITHRFSTCCGKNVILRSCNTVATRVRNYSHALVFSNTVLEPDEVFEVSLQEMAPQWSGTLHIGVTTLQVSDAYPSGNLPGTIAGLAADTWYITGNEVRRNSTTLKVNYCPSLEWLTTGDRVGVRRGADATLSFLLNGEDMGVAATNLPKRVFAVVDLYGSTLSVGITSVRASTCHEITPGEEGEAAAAMMESLRSSKLHDSLEILLDTATPTQQPNKPIDTGEATTQMVESKSLESRPDEISENISSSLPPPSTSVATNTSVTITMTSATITCPQSSTTATTSQQMSEIEVPQPFKFEFHENHGRNVQLGEGRLTAKRIASYNQGVVISSRPLPRDRLFQVRIDSLNPRWVSSILCGVTCLSPDKTHSPVTALGFKKNSWIICSDCVFHNGIKVKGRYGPNLDSLQTCHLVGILIDSKNQLHLYVNGVDQGVAACEIPPECYAVIDLYGQCEEVTIIRSSEEANLQIPAGQGTLMDSSSGQILPSLAEHESLSEKADLECDEKEKLSSMNSGDASLSTDFPQSPPPLAITVVATSTNPTANDVANGQLKASQSSQSLTISHLPVSITSGDSNTVSNSMVEVGSNISSGVPQIPTSLPTPASTPCQVSCGAPPVTPCSTPQTALSKNCEYQNACSRFRNILGLPDGFFNSDYNVCYCETCYKLRGDQAYNHKGDPPVEYGVPFGWCRFSLRQPPGADVPSDKWHVAFYGAKLGDIRRILDHGKLLLPGELGLERCVSKKDKSKEDDSDGSQLLFSPSIRYAISAAFATKNEYVDPKTKKHYQAYAAFQILVQPGSYKIGPPSIAGVAKPVDPHIDHDASEWVTKERGATVLSALLIKLEGL